MDDLVEETERGIRARLRELAPVVAEFERLEAAYAALDGSGADGVGDRRSAKAGTRAREGGNRRARARAASHGSGTRAKRGQNKAAVHGVIAEPRVRGAPPEARERRVSGRRPLAASATRAASGSEQSCSTSHRER
jgi:hypothetical protein